MNKHILYLAAGNSRRFGTNKLLYEYHGKPLYEYGLDVMSSFCQKRQDCSLLVVSQYEEILRQVRQKEIPAVYSPDSSKGISFTIKAALQALGDVPAEDFLIFAVADQPYLTERTLEHLVEKADSDVEAVSVVCEGVPGNPTMFSARLIPELLALREDEGGRKVLRNHKCVYVEVEDRRELCDIDTEGDL